METLVDLYLRETIDRPEYKQSGICFCSCCTAHIKAEALNHLQPFYVTCKEGEVYGLFGHNDLQSKANIMTEIIKAITNVASTAHQ